MVVEGACKTLRQGIGEGGSLTKEEDREVGAVKASIWFMYFKLLGVKHCILLLLLLVLYQSASAYSTFWMAHWTAQVKEGSDDSVFYLTVYGSLLFGYVAVASVQCVLWVNRAIVAGEQIHDRALWRLLRAPMSYFDTTVKGRIVNRFSNDLQKVDMGLQGNLKMFTTIIARGAICMGIVVVQAPVILAVFLPLFIVYLRTMNHYRASVRELQRLSSKGASPIYAMFSETLDGVVTTRAYDRAAELECRNQDLLGNLLRPWYLQGVAGQWLNLRLQMMGAVVSSATAAVAVYEYGGKETEGGVAGMVGFTLLHALSITDILNGFINTFTQCENNLVAMERLNAMGEIQQEAPLRTPEDPQQETGEYPQQDSLPWPSRGTIEFSNVWMAYRDGLEPALKGVSFTVKPGEKVGIVGRRGAGKSSILIALFRLAELSQAPDGTRGRIVIDGKDVGRMGLSTLRHGMCIIPQDPVLFSGTLKSNLDPDGVRSDAELRRAMEDVGMWEFVSHRHGQLEMTVEAKGENLACGQRQLICLARALLRGSKILVLDEATANVDQASDDAIQTRLRELRGVTMLTIAHRLDTIIDYDKVVVLSEGVVKECDEPRKLAATPGSIFGAMWEKYNIKACGGGAD